MILRRNENECEVTHSGKKILAHSITSSARCCKNKGTSRPSAFAVLRLMTSSNFVGPSTARSSARRVSLCRQLFVLIPR
jgi:hypothetical protein